MQRRKKCPLCAKIAESINEKKNTRDCVGIYKDLKLNDGCSTCQLVSKILGRKRGGSPTDDDPIYMDRADSPRYFRLGIAPPDPSSVIYVEQQLIRVGHHPSEEEKIRPIVGGQRVRLDKVQQWIRSCDQHHAGTCHLLSDPWREIEPVSNLLLIDVERKCLVQQPGTVKYFCLSYVWGPPTQDPFQTTRGNYEALCHEGAFDLPSYRSLLPATIRDSILLTQKMGVKYLWVDRFCIVQDDPTVKHAQLKSMASVYSNAYVTIAACEGNDDRFGLPGISEERPRNSPYRTFDFDQSCCLIDRDPVDIDESFESARVYHTRGWTFQEWALSSRILYFDKNTVCWKCNLTKELENGERPSAPIPSLEDTTEVLTPWPNLDSYASMVEAYSPRKLSYSSDALNAFSAIIFGMGRAMQGGMLFGLPELFFDGTLLWKPNDDTILSRRSDNSFPSWSWVGWHGAVDTSLWQDAHRYIDSGEGGNFLNIHPLVTWYKVDTSNGARLPIKNTYYSRLRRQGEDMPHSILPKGWRFCDNVPLVDAPQPQSNTIWSHILHFSTHRLYARIGQPCLEYDTLQNPYIESLDGDVVGILEHSFEGSLPTGKTCELICIGQMDMSWGNSTYYRMYESRRFHKSCAKGCFQDRKPCSLGSDWRYECYNVLWIEWEDGIAYRVALGRIFKDYWDKAEKEKIDVRLG